MTEKMMSVIIPVYNAEEYIKECLDSIIGQTIGIEHIELIVVDDRSTDRSLQYLMEYEKKYPDSILLVPLEENGGQANARNIGMDYVTTPYFAFVDADDWVEPDMYEKMLGKMEKYECDMVHCFHVEHLEDCEEHYVRTKNEEGLYYMGHKKKAENPSFESGGGIWSFLYCTQWIRKHGFRFKHFKKYEDNYWSGIVFFFAESVYVVPKCLYHYRIRERSNSHSRNDKGHFERLKVELEKLQFFQENGLFEDNYERIQKQFLEIFYSNTLHIIWCQFDYIPLDIIRDMQLAVKEIYPDYLEYCKNSERNLEQVLTVAFDFPIEIWEDYKKAYLEWVQERKSDKITQFYIKMRSALNL